MLGRLFSTTIAKVLGAIAAALALTCIGLLLWGRAGYASADRWQARSGIEAENHRTTKANFRAAQDAAGQAAQAARHATEAQYRELAERADHAEQDLAASHDAASRFADARRVPVGTGGSLASASGGARASGQADAATRGNGPGANAVVLSRAEFEQLAGNTLRLERVRRWGAELITEGLAVSAGTTNGVQP